MAGRRRFAVLLLGRGRERSMGIGMAVCMDGGWEEETWLVVEAIYV